MDVRAEIAEAFLLIGSIGPGVLPTCLVSVQMQLNCPDSLEGALAQVVAADAEDYSAKRRLRLLNVCKHMCKRKDLMYMAVLVSVLHPLDAAIYKILGGGKRKERITALELSDVERSPVCKAIDFLVGLLCLCGWLVAVSMTLM